MTLKSIFFLASCALSLNSFAGTMGPTEAGPPPSASYPWAVIGSLGYVNYLNSDCDGQTAVGRFAIVRELFTIPYSSFGLEMGVQSGNTMGLDVPEATLEELGGVPIQSTMKPMLDLLATVKFNLLGSPFFAQLKGGAIYRQWQFDGRNSILNLSKINAEVQAGFGYSIGQYGSLSLLYQGVDGGILTF